MSGSLARLVLRAQGRLQVAAPLLPSRYAAAGSPGGLSEETAVEPAQPAASHREPPPPAIPPAPLGATPKITTEANGPLPTVESAATIPVAAAKSASVERVGGGPPEPPSRLMPTASEPVRPAPPVDAVTPPALPAPAESMPVNLDRRPSPGVSPFLAREAALAAGRATVETPRAAAPASAPDVHISIGRVEVHAAPMRPAPVRAAPARYPALSLADYLARRR